MEAAMADAGSNTTRRRVDPGRDVTDCGHTAIGQRSGLTVVTDWLDASIESIVIDATRTNRRIMTGLERVSNAFFLPTRFLLPSCPGCFAAFGFNRTLSLAEVAVSCHSSTALERSIFALTHLTVHFLRSQPLSCLEIHLQIQSHHPDSHAPSAMLCRGPIHLPLENINHPLNCSSSSSWRPQSTIVTPELASFHLFLHQSGERKRTLLPGARSVIVIFSVALANLFTNIDSNSAKVFTKSLGSSAYHSKAVAVKLLTNCRKSKASLPPALASRSAFLSAGTFRRRILEPGVQMSCPNAHRAGLAVFVHLFPEHWLLPPERSGSMVDRQLLLLSSNLSIQLPILPSNKPSSVSVLLFTGVDIPVGRIVAFAVTTKTLPPVILLLVAGALDWESLSKTEILL
ncbi:hypothetical protein M5K25_008432 [Dendrobium thyrsiflorum]|uniref:Uncharacterized protein n=1 Tax=Dendrobium thyrsiflorum TaxID=117978 RepID=A0ABD0V9V1_DENTH